MATSEEIARAAEIIQQGGLVAFPTETVYGLGANALDVQAIHRIYKAKERPASSPLIVHVPDVAMARSLAAKWPPLADLLARFFWPGPLTMVMHKAKIVPLEVTAGFDSVGLRVPSHPVARELLQRALRPVAAPSANRFTELSPTTAEHVRQSLGDRVDMILDGGSTSVGIESTVITLAEDEPAILRPGMISANDLKSATGLSWPLLNSEAHAGASPGLHKKHYSPKTPFYIVGLMDDPPAGRGKILEMPLRPVDYAAVLYATLHYADKQGWDWIGVWEPPDLPEWQGIRDRLKRASSA